MASSFSEFNSFKISLVLNEEEYSSYKILQEFSTRILKQLYSAGGPDRKRDPALPVRVRGRGAGGARGRAAEVNGHEEEHGGEQGDLGTDVTLQRFDVTYRRFKDVWKTRLIWYFSTRILRICAANVARYRFTF